MNANYVTPSKRIRELREERGLTQQMLGDLLFISQSTISYYENGNAEISLDALVQYAKFFNVSTEYILCMTDDRKSYHGCCDKDTEQLLQQIMEMTPVERGKMIGFASCIFEFRKER